jgi:glycosyltransferase involved in cell wall biosynthesis
MRILYLNHNVAWHSGTFFRAYQAARHLAARGHAVSLLSISPRRRIGFHREVSSGVDIIHTPDLFWGRGRTGWDPWDTANRLAYVNRGGWDIIHAWDTRPAVILPALHARRRSRALGGKLVIDWCDWWGRGGTQVERQDGWGKRLYAPVETYFEEAFRTRADATTVISRALQQRAIGLGVPPERMWLLPNGCETGAPDLPDRLAARRRLGLPEAAPLVIGVGALIRSDAALLFETLLLIQQQRPDCIFALVGRHGARVPDALHQSPGFLETGYLAADVLQDYMAACDALLVPLADTLANRARWPSKVNPFLAAGRAVVISAVGDLPALLQQEAAALVVAPSAAAIAGGVLRLLEMPELRASIESSAHRLAHNQLSWNHLASQLEDVYRTVREEQAFAK